VLGKSWLCILILVFTVTMPLASPADAAAGVTPITSCSSPNGYTISSPGTYVVTKDLTAIHDVFHGIAFNNCIVISASDVILDLGGHTLTGIANFVGVTIKPGADDVTVEDGTINGFSTTIQTSALHSTIKDLTLQTFESPSLLLIGADNSIVKNNEVNYSNGGGIVLIRTNNTVVAGNTLFGVDVVGIEIADGSSHNEVIRPLC